MNGETTVTIRMYNPGFGDCFLITVAEAGRSWRMLVDCGVHAHGLFKADGKPRGIGAIVAAVIDQLAAESVDGVPAVDVVVATHRHADHISGFADDAWEAVRVGEVWVPFVENPDDPGTKALKGDLAAEAERLRGLVDHALGVAGRTRELALAHWFAVNSSGNAAATRRLVQGEFANRGAVRTRFLPDENAAANVIATPFDGVVVHVLGPSRDPERIKRMNPPKSVQWLEEADGESAADTDREDLFDAVYRVPAGEVEARVPAELFKSRNAMRLNGLAYDQAGLLAAASVLERSVNNTSVFFVLDVRRSRFVFVGDSQQGAWEHVLDDPASRALVTDAVFYKVGHHGSHNATPRRFVEEVLGDGATAMVPVGRVKAWADSIPNEHLLEGLARRRARVIRADAPPPDGDGVESDGADRLWTQVRFVV